MGAGRGRGEGAQRVQGLGVSVPRGERISREGRERGLRGAPVFARLS